MVLQQLMAEIREELQLVWDRAMESSLRRQEAAFSLVEAFMVENILLKKLDYPKLRDYLNQNVPSVGNFPCASKLHQDYLTAVKTSHVQHTKSALAEYEFFSAVDDEATDPQVNYMLHILFVLRSLTDWNLPDYVSSRASPPHICQVFYCVSSHSEDAEKLNHLTQFKQCQARRKKLLASYYPEIDKKKIEKATSKLSSTLLLDIYARGKVIDLDSPLEPERPIKGATSEDYSP
ncbi:hypothetical protein Y1Q_0003224 [Alligator mississippiensis]|uniref:Uncharacterized protein n=1 Tax=Alligator mississippiensis TaxID=8496 RepID=A0A151MDY1_ALLMI|nr:hypothetical protein Y1Q_0003224 [Alligator mississippiensis]